MPSLKEKLSALVGAKFREMDLPEDLGTVRLSDRPDLAQFQCNGAMAAARIAKKPPPEIAKTLVTLLKNDSVFKSVEIAGPGFINLVLEDSALAEFLEEIFTDTRSGVKKYSDNENVILDYGGPNAAKAMHVGHVRPTVIGDCLKRIYKFAGYNAIGDVHIGDLGLQIGQIIAYFEDKHPDWPYFHDDNEKLYPVEPPFSFEELETIYPVASARCKEDRAFLEKARQATADLQKGHNGYLAIWRHIMDQSIKHMKQNFDRLDVHFELWKGEADVDPLIPEVAEDMTRKGILVESEGAQVIHVKEDSDNKDMPPLMFYKSSGAVTYGTTDVATIYDRIQTFPDLKQIIYIADKRQTLHFEQVFRACRKAGYLDGIHVRHVGFGTLNGPDGKPFKTRQGGTVRLNSLIDMAMEKARKRLVEAELAEDFPEAERDNIAWCVALAALKFADLINQPHVDYIFNLDHMTRFEGKTGPYLLYQAVRIQSLLRKAEEKKFEFSKEIRLSDAMDRDLALILAEFPDAFDSTFVQLSPHVLAEYAYKLASGFSSFYGKCHILTEKDEDVRNARLALSKLTHTILVRILDLMGIPVPLRM